VGEFAQDVPIDADTLNVLYLKMLKSTNARVDLPLWDLMMKNVYSIGAYSVNQQDFKLDVLYQEPGGGERRFLPEGPRAGVPLITLFNLDRLNSQLDPLPDGQFDFVSGITINPRNGKVTFPVLEPFGSYLDKTFDNDPVKKKYVYQQLYDSTITKAREYPEFNRFVMRGSYRSSSSSELSLGAFNIPQGSVKVTAGGQQLVEGRDYEVDYNIGRVKILNESIMQSGVPVNVSFEDNSLFGFQTRTLFGTRLDYKVSDDFTIGGTFMRLSERPFTQKVNIGDDPIANNVYGLDIQYSKEAPWLTKLIDKLPLLQTKEQSKISFSAEGAWLKPGHSKAIDQTDNAGVVYLDDFEGSTSNIDLRTQPLAWALASTPRGRFPEADLVNDLAYGYNRAKLAWYRIDPTLRDDNTLSAYEAQYSETDVFPNYQNPDGNFTNQLFTLDVAYYPEERGPYNFDVAGKAGISAGIDNTGKLKNPKSRWGGITRSIETNDFEAANVEFIEVWMLSPFLEGRGGH
jgi:cell surface protein SprA